jgi:hypothetical protein
VKKKVRCFGDPIAMPFLGGAQKLCAKQRDPKITKLKQSNIKYHISKTNTFLFQYSIHIYDDVKEKFLQTITDNLIYPPKEQRNLTKYLTKILPNNFISLKNIQ